MSIIFDSVKKCFLLNTPGTTYCIRLYKERYLLHGGWFHRMEQWSDTCVMPVQDHAFSPVPADQYEDSCFSPDSQQEEYPVSGRTDFRSAAIETEMADGSGTFDLFYEGYRIIPGKPAIPGLPSVYVYDNTEADTLELDLRDSESGLLVTLHYSVWNICDVICRHVTVKNTGTGTGIYKGKNIILRKAMSTSMDFSGSRYRMLQLSGAHARERHPVFRPLMPGMQSIESRRGTSSHQENPFVALLGYNADEEQGEVFGFSLVYSGNFIALAEVDQFNMTRIQTGINPCNFTWRLEPGESFFTPETVQVRSEQGLGGMSRIYHWLYREHLCRGRWRDADRPVAINNWEATFFDFTEDKLVKIAKAAADTGVELFVLDDGWFAKRNSDRSSLGDWYANKEKLPGGLKSLAARIKGLGLKFGLWVEPEMISPDSDLYRSHQDWCLHIHRRSRSVGRNQYVLDLSRSDVVDYLAETMSSVFSSADISYIKWDFNRSLTEVGSAVVPPELQMETSHRFILGLYRLLETLTARFPDILFESCSGGGGRFDPGLLYYMPQSWTSDNTDALSRVNIQLGTSIVYPASCMSCHVSAVPNQQVGRFTPFSLRSHVAMAGVYGYELDPAEMPEAQLKEMKEQISLYRKIRHTIQFGRLYRIESPWTESSVAECTDYSAWEYIAPDNSQVVCTVVWTYAEANVPPEIIKLRGLDEKTVYTVEYPDVKEQPGKGPEEKKQKCSGAELMYSGLRLQCLPQYEDSLLLVLSEFGG
jgi:alpha-galactosidase